MKPNVNPSDLRDSFFDTLYEFVAEDPSVMVLTADHGAFGLDRILKDYPKQAYNVGIAEQNMVNVAAGLALSGKKVYIYTIANFIVLRCFEQLSASISGNQLSINMISVGGGFTYSSDGPTHQGLLDMNAASMLPGLSVYNASDAALTRALAYASRDMSGTKYFRLEKGKFPLLAVDEVESLQRGMRLISQGEEILVFATGIMNHIAVDLVNKLRRDGISAGCVDLFRTKPIDGEYLSQLVQSVRGIVSLEENYLHGGMGSSICTILQDHSVSRPVLRLGVPDEILLTYGDRDWMQRQSGLDLNSIHKRITRWAYAKKIINRRNSIESSGMIYPYTHTEEDNNQLRYD